MEEWISCKDETPELGIEVLCWGVSDYYTEHHCFVGYFSKTGAWAKINNVDYIYDGRGENYPVTVTHWMKLPDSPTLLRG